MSKYFLAALIVLSACKHVSKVNNLAIPPNSQSVTVPLQGGLDTIRLLLPNRYDTSFTWIHYSDCGKPCEKRKYRFQPASLPAFPETGYSYQRLTDSVDQFTIVHNPYILPEDVDDPNNQTFISSFHDHKKWILMHDPSMEKITSDTIEYIGDRYFSIIITEIYDTTTREYIRKLLSSTTIKTGTIDFNFELRTKENNSSTKSFLQEAAIYLRTIRFARNKNDKF